LLTQSFLLLRMPGQSEKEIWWDRGREGFLLWISHLDRSLYWINHW